MARKASDPLSPQIIDGIIDRVRRERAVSIAALRLGKLDSAGQGQLLAALARAGLEHTGKAIRMPIAEQLRRSLTQVPSGMPVPAAERSVKGARSTAEIKLVIGELVDAAELALTTDGRNTRLVLAAGAALLSSSELAALAELAGELAALTKATRAVKGKPRATLTRRTLSAPLAALRKLADEPAEAVERTHASLPGVLRDALLAATSNTGLVRIPDVVRSLEDAYSRGAVLSALQGLASDGGLELRPESSVTGLPDEDRIRCPVGLDGTPLSYARLIEQVQA